MLLVFFSKYPAHSSVMLRCLLVRWQPCSSGCPLCSYLGVIILQKPRGLVSWIVKVGGKKGQPAAAARNVRAGAADTAPKGAAAFGAAATAPKLITLFSLQCAEVSGAFLKSHQNFFFVSWNVCLGRFSRQNSLTTCVMTELYMRSEIPGQPWVRKGAKEGIKLKQKTHIHRTHWPRLVSPSFWGITSVTRAHITFAFACWKKTKK